jgi:hypothetical protein
MASFKIVVARYNEPIEWLKVLINDCVIYNKGSPLNIKNEIMLENVGRESDTYLNYIITNYDKLPDVVIFTQANISDHGMANDVNYLLSIANSANTNKKSKNYSTNYLKHNDDAGEYSCFDGKWNVLKDGTYFLNDNYKNNVPVAFDDWFREHIQPDYPNPIHIYCNAIFAVKKELILRNSVEYYKRLILEVNHHINSTEGHFLERSWYYIFNDH